jgi:hypothetical protein
MRLNNISRACLALSIAGAGLSAQANDFTFSGNVALNTDIVKVSFTLDNAATSVKVWTDSFMNGVNYDPITALWQKVGSDYQLIDENDDNDSIAPGQTYYDSGFSVASLAAGDYLFTVAAYDNFASGQMLSDGFDNFGGATPIPIATWCQPAAHNCSDPTLNQKGTFWRVNLSGVDSAIPPPTTTPAVPEPSTYALMLLGLGALSWAARRQKKA